MKLRRKVVQVCFACIAALLLAFMPWRGGLSLPRLNNGSVPLLFAQSDGVAKLQITEVNTLSFPEIQVYVYGENLPDALSALPLRLEEDRVEQPIFDSRLVEVGTQTAIVLDASRNILSTGNTDAPRLDEVSRSVGKFVQLGLLSAQTDWLAAFGTGEVDGEYETIADWQQDHQGVVNSLIQWRPENRPVFTSLFGLVRAAFNQFETSPAPANSRRSMVIFSDGADIVSNIETDDIVRMANELDVRIHTVLLGTPARDSRRILGRLADLTGGLFVELNAIEDLDPIWQTIGAERLQQLLTYRLSQAQPQEVRVVANLGNGREIDAALDFPVVGARPAEIQVLYPTADQVFTLSANSESANSESANSESAEANVLPVQVAFSWPDGHPRNFQRVEYTLDADTRPVQSPPFDQFEFRLSEIRSGRHTIRVTAVDELGISSTSLPLSVQIRLPETASQSETSSTEPVQTVDGAPPSTADGVDAIALPQAEGLRIGRYALPAFVRFAGYTIPLDLTTLGILFLLPLLLVSLLVLLRNRTRANNPYFASDTHSTLDPYADLRQPDPNVVTVPSMSAFEMDDVSTEPVRMLEFDVVAHLVLHSGATHLPERFPLHENQQIRIGRHSSYSDIILEDTRVSRQHAIIEWENGHHVIHDEGSAGGTYVNKRRMGVGDKHLLQEGDVVNFNEIAYRYETLRSSDESQPNAEHTQI